MSNYLTIQALPVCCGFARDTSPKPSYVLSDQVKSLDWTKRNVAFITKAPADSLAQVTVFASGIVEGKK